MAGNLYKNLRSISLSRTIFIVSDFFIVWASTWLAFILRHNLEKQRAVLYNVGHTRLFVFLLSMSAMAVIIFYLIGFYRHIWRYASIMQYLLLAVGTFFQTWIFILCTHFFIGHVEWPIFAIYWMLVFLMISGSRIAYRIIRNQHKFVFFSYWRRLIRTGDLPNPQHKRVLVIGAGTAASRIIRDMQGSGSGYLPLAVIDDDPDKHRMNILGLPIIGGRDEIGRAAAEFNIDEIILAIPSASSEIIREFVRLCRPTGCRIKTLPGIRDLIDGKISVSDIKEVSIEDLLGRPEIDVLDAKTAAYLKDQIVLVTGGGGSIGSELCRQIARHNPGRLIIFDIYENNAYHLQQELIARHPGLDLVLLIGSVRDRDRLEQLFIEYRPDIIFHAAAHKHVPLMETSPGEAVKNNIFGTHNVASAAGRSKAGLFVLISTDKAVNPANVMGATKRVAEMIVQTMNGLYPETVFTAVRFGNVLGSSGSVIPLFQQQIREERRVTVTHPDITRYFMTIPEAARLVIQAGSFASSSSCIYVLDMGMPVRILDLARDMITLSGLEIGKDVQIHFTGLRPGEKMYEELYYDTETMEKTGSNKIFKLEPNQDQSQLEAELDLLRQRIGWDSEAFRALCRWISASQRQSGEKTNEIPHHPGQEVAGMPAQSIHAIPGSQRLAEKP